MIKINVLFPSFSYFYIFILFLFVKIQGIGVINASPVGMGLLSCRGPPAWHPALTTIKYAIQQIKR